MRQKEIISRCKTCGTTAFWWTTKKVVPRKERIFECNDCFIKRQERERELKKKSQCKLPI